MFMLQGMNLKVNSFLFSTCHVLILQGATVCVCNADSRGLDPAEWECTCSAAEILARDSVESSEIP